LKEPFKKETNQQFKNTYTPNKRIGRKLASVFLSGIAAFSTINYFLGDYQINYTVKQTNQINYASQNIPDKIKPTKAVIFLHFKYLKVYDN